MAARVNKPRLVLWLAQGLVLDLEPGWLIPRDSEPYVPASAEPVPARHTDEKDQIVGRKNVPCCAHPASPNDSREHFPIQDRNNDPDSIVTSFSVQDLPLPCTVESE